MGQPLRVLIVEDSESDAGIAVRLLAKAGYDTDAQRVETASEMRAALAAREWDVVIADYRLPQFDAPGALAVLQQTGLDLPFIVVSGTVGEDLAVAMMKAGAHDYLMKDRLTRLAPAVDRELREARARRERLEAQAALRSSESRLSAIFQASPLSIAVARLSDGTLIDVNPAWEATTGFSREETIGHTAIELNVWVQPAERARLVRTMVERGGERSVEVQVRQKSGDVSHLLMSAEPIELAGERCMLTVAADINERKWAEEALRESEQAYRDLVENLSDVIFTVNVAGRIEYVSPAVESVLGFAPADLMGERFAEFVHPGDRAIVAQAFRDVMAGSFQPSEYRCATRSGDYRWVRVSSRQLVRNGRVEGLAGVLTDMTERKRVEEELHRSEVDLRTAQKVANVGSWAWYVQSGRLEWSDQMFRIFGIDKEAFTGDLADVTARAIHPEDRAAVERANRDVFDHKKPSPLEYRVVWADGTVRVVWAEAGELILDEAGNPSVLKGIAQDITERKRTEAVLAQERDLLNNLLVNTPDHIYFKDRQSRFTRINLAQCHWLGLGDPSDAVGKTDADFFSAEHAQQAFADEQHIMSTGQPLVGLEEKETWLDGRVNWASSTKVPIRDASGQIGGLFGISRDITERKQFEQALAASEERFRSVFEGMTDGIVVADAASGAVVMTNPAIGRMLGYSEEELLRLTVDDLHPVEERPVVRERFGGTRAEGQLVRAGIPVVRKDGSRLAVEINSFPLTLAGRKCLLGVFRDMTAFHELEQQLRQAQKMEAVGQLAGGVAHDFNNILSVIQGYCDLILKNLREDDPLARSVRQIQSSGERAAGLTRQLLAFSRKQPLRPEVLDLNVTVRNLEAMLRRLIGEDIDFVTSLASTLGRVKADPGQIEQVLINLAVNARDAMPQGGKLLVETADIDLDEEYASTHAGVVPGPHVMLAVTDTGSGMDQRTQERVFEPFFTTKEKGKGTGLGLATVYGIVKQSGGSIWIYSEVGRGTTFKVYLPRTGETAAPRAARPDGALRMGAGEHVLVVEDEAGMREIVKEVLDDLGYHATVAANGGEALLAVEEGQLKPDLLLTDVVMPGMSGSVLAERLQRANPGLKVLYMSGYTDDSVVRHGVLAAGVHFLQKPFKLVDLAAKVFEVLRSDADPK